MSSISIRKLKELFNVYSPLESDKRLEKHYYNITHESGNPSNIREIYNKQILDGFWNESVIKSRFVEKFSFKRSPKSTITIFELNVGKSRADLCMVNGKSMVFEIKTAYDTFNRLEKQLADYEKTFDYVSLIIPLKSLEKALKVIPTHVGIITYRKNRLNNITFEEMKAPEYSPNLDSSMQLHSLTKSHLTSLCKAHSLKAFSSKEKMIQTLLTRLSSTEINKIYKNYLKSKFASKWKFVYENKTKINSLDYQWFFKNPLPAEKVYR